MTTFHVYTEDGNDTFLGTVEKEGDFTEQDIGDIWMAAWMKYKCHVRLVIIDSEGEDDQVWHSHKDAFANYRAAKAAAVIEKVNSWDS